MNFKEFEERISNINNQIFAFFMQIEEEENKQINDVFQSLKQNLDSQKNILVDFERQLKEDDDQYQSKIAALEKEILNIASEPETYLHILEEKKAFLSQKKNDEQKRILALQRRRRSEFAHRINTLNKELSLLLKEHNNQLEEEEKNYKAKETELMRRMNIDLQKANEKTVKASSDLEKQLLETNDLSGIAEIKKKIVAIRTEGFKEQESIKNKYEFSFIENTLDFKRFYEKISLDNALTQEDFAVKIKALEKQRNDLELAEQLEFALFGFELDKQYNEWEKEQNLHAIEWQIQNFAQQMLIKNQIQDEKHQYDLHHFENNKNYLQKAHEVDTMQFASYRPLELLISNNIKKQCDCLLEGLADCIEIFQAHLIAIVENTWNLKKSLRNDLSKFLLVTIKNELPLIEPHYSHELTKIEHFCLEYYKLQNKRFKNFLRSVASQAHNLLQEVKATMAIFKNYYLEEQAYREEMDKKMNSSLLKSYENALLYLAGDYHQEENNEKNYHRQVQDEKEKHRLSMELKKQTAMKLYHDQLKAIEEKSKKATLENQRLVADEENNYQLFIKNSKQKQSAFKRDFSDHLILHERSLDKQYRLALQRNEKERKAKIKAL